MGSSRKMISGRPINVIARSSRRRIPPEYVDASLSAEPMQIEHLQEFVSASAAFVLAEVVKIGHEEKVFLAGQVVVDRRELSGDADARTHRVRIVGRVVPGDADVAAVCGNEGREDFHDGGLAGAVGAEERKDGSAVDRDVDSVQYRLVVVGLLQTRRGDGWFTGHQRSFR